jgi:hypothetical protein
MIDKFMILKADLNQINKKIAICRTRNDTKFITGSCCFKRTETLEQIIREKNYLKKQINDYYADINNIQKSSHSTGVVFATFKDSHDYEAFYNFFPQTAFMGLIYKFLNMVVNCICPCCFSQNYKRKLILINSLKVQRAPEPSDILWQNLEYSDLSKAIRKLWVYIVSVIMISISFTIILALNVVQNKFKESLSAIINSAISVAISTVIIVINYVLNSTLRKLSE